MKARQLLAALRRYVGAIPADAEAIRRYIEGKPMPENAGPKTRHLAVRLKSFVERARYESEGDPNMTAACWDGFETDRELTGE